MFIKDHEDNLSLKNAAMQKKSLALLRRSKYTLMDNFFTRDICNGEYNRYE